MQTLVQTNITSMEQYFSTVRYFCHVASPSQLLRLLLLLPRLARSAPPLPIPATVWSRHML